MAEIHSGHAGDAENLLPSPEEVEALYGEEKRKIYDTAGDGRRRALLKIWTKEKTAPPPPKPALPPEDARIRAAAMELLELSRPYVVAPGGDAYLRARRIRYRHEMEQPGTNAYRRAQRALQCHIIDSFLEKNTIDYPAITRAVQADPLCVSFDEDIIKQLYLHFIRVLQQDGQILEEIFDDSDDDL